MLSYVQTDLASKRQYMLSHNSLSTQRAFRLLPHPVCDTGPAKHMAAGSGAGITHRFQT